MSFNAIVNEAIDNKIEKTIKYFKNKTNQKIRIKRRIDSTLYGTNDKMVLEFIYKGFNFLSEILVKEFIFESQSEVDTTSL